MTIIELILAGLQQKFSGVDTAILTRIASKKAEGVTDEAKIDSIVEGIGFSDVLNFYGDFRAGDASKTAVTNYEKKHNLKNGKPIDKPDPDPTPKPDGDNMPTWAKALIESNKTLTKKLEKIETEKQLTTRQQQILAKAKEYGIPEELANDFKIADNTDLDLFFKDKQQTLANYGFTGVTPPDKSNTDSKTEEEALIDQINKGTKEIVEQSKK